MIEGAPVALLKLGNPTISICPPLSAIGDYATELPSCFASRSSRALASAGLMILSSEARTSATPQLTWVAIFSGKARELFTDHSTNP
jgi:hypothetical protein